MIQERTLFDFGYSYADFCKADQIGPIKALFYKPLLRYSTFPRLYGASWEHHRYFLKFLYADIHGRTVLELGAESGETADLLSSDNAYICVDRSSSLLSAAAARFRHADFPEPRFIRGSAEDLIFREESFDFILCNPSGLLTNYLMAAIREASRVLKDGGKLIGYLPQRGYAEKKLSDNLRSNEELGIMFKHCGFSYTPLEFENGSLLYFTAEKRR